MLNRWIGILAAAFMLLANGAVVYRDIVPHWLVGEPPPCDAGALDAGQEWHAQVGIYDGAGRLIGRSWTITRCMVRNSLVAVSTTTVLEPIPLPGGVLSPRVRVETDIEYHPDEALVDELKFQIIGLGMTVSLHGVALPSGEFPCEWCVGEQRGEIILDSRAPSALGDVIRPFDRLPDLYVGRSWRLDLLDPLSQIIPGLEQAGLSLDPVLIQVTGTEQITHDGKQIEAFIVEGGGAIAWVAPDGVVLRQEVTVPFLGQLTLIHETYDEQTRRAALGIRGPTTPDQSDAATEK